MNNLVEKLSDYRNPFHDNCQELLVLHTRKCADDFVVDTVSNLEKVGSSQYKAFQKNVLCERTKSLHCAIKRNNLTFFKTPKLKKSNISKQLSSARNDANSFGRLYIANQPRGGDIDFFFT